MALGTTQAALAKRLQAAQARVTAEARSQLASASSNVSVSPLPNPPASRNHKQPPAKPTPQPKPAKAPKKGRDGGKGQAADGRALEAASATEIAAALRGAAANPQMARLVSDEQLVGVWQAIVDGAARLGPAGAADRAALGRAIGLPIHQYAGGGGKGAGPGGGAAVRARLETALRRVNRHSAVTQEPETAETDVETAA